jgi:hypothetical protein
VFRVRRPPIKNCRRPADWALRPGRPYRPSGLAAPAALSTRVRRLSTVLPPEPTRRRRCKRTLHACPWRTRCRRLRRLQLVETIVSTCGRRPRGSFQFLPRSCCRCSLAASLAVSPRSCNQNFSHLRVLKCPRGDVLRMPWSVRNRVQAGIILVAYPRGRAYGLRWFVQVGHAAILRIESLEAIP